MYIFIFSHAHIFARVNLRLLLNPFSQQLLDEIRQILAGIRVFQKPYRCFLGVFANQHGRGLTLRVTPLAGWPSSPTYWFIFYGSGWRRNRLFLARPLFELGKNTGEFTLFFRHG